MCFLGLKRRHRLSEVAFLTFELKTPSTPIWDSQLLIDATQKAQRWGSPFFVIWNMKAAELYRTPKEGTATPADRKFESPLNSKVTKVDDWLNPQRAVELQHVCLELLDKAWSIDADEDAQLIEIEASVFVERLAERLKGLKSYLVPALSNKASKSKILKNRLKEIAAEQGFASFVDDIQEAIAGQYRT